MRPVPYPVLRSRAEWDAFVEKLYTTWGTRDFNPQTVTEPAAPRRRWPDALRPARLRPGHRGATNEVHSAIG